LQVRFLAVPLGNEQAVYLVSEAVDCFVARRPPVDHRPRVDVSAFEGVGRRLVHRSSSFVPAMSKSGSPVPMWLLLSTQRRCTSCAIPDGLVFPPRKSAAIDHSDSPGSTTCAESAGLARCPDGTAVGDAAEGATTRTD